MLIIADNFQEGVQKCIAFLNAFRLWLYINLLGFISLKPVCKSIFGFLHMTFKNTPPNWGANGILQGANTALFACFIYGGSIKYWFVWKIWGLRRIDIAGSSATRCLVCVFCIQTLAGRMRGVTLLLGSPLHLTLDSPRKLKKI